MSKPKTAYILLFRGVGGTVKLPTAPLREALTEAGFENVATYINSGNAVLLTDLPRARAIASVAKICENKFGYTRAIRALTLPEWETLIANNPFPNFETGKHLHAVALAGDPAEEAVEKLRAHAVAGEEIKVVERVVYLHAPHGFGTSKMVEKFDKGIGVANTGRNWNTVLKLLDLAKKAAGS